MFKKLLIVFIVVVSLAGLIGIASALFTSQKIVDNNLFTSGTVVLNTSPADMVVTFSNMAPGDEYTAPITVTNEGTLDLRYAVKSVATDTDGKGLMGQLDLTIKTGVADCSNAGFGTGGTVLYATGDLGSALGIKLIGDNATGAQAGDRELVANTGSEVLCFNVLLPTSTGNAFQGATTTATFTFDAEQIKNN